MTISVLDWVVIGIYLVGMVGFGLWLARKTSSSEDYYLGGRNIPPWIAAMSIMATQTSTISLIGAPAFVALKAGGGLRYLQWEIALPLSMLLIMILIVPLLWTSGVTTVYEFLERRFGLSARLVLSAIFLLSRSLATGVTIYATAVVLNVATGAPFWVLVLIIGGVCLVYSTLGGLVADVYTDSIQLVILWGCVFVSIGFIIWELGGVAPFADMQPDRSVALDFSQHGLGDSSKYGFWPLLIGGIFLYMSYYGTDQTQAQRVLAAPSVQAARKSLFINGLMRFPLVLTYVIFGVALAALVANSPDFQSVVNSEGFKMNDLVPIFIIRYLPTGVVGLVIAGMLAASMSSLDSTFNSLSASTMTDYVQRFGLLKGASKRKFLLVSRGITFGWGILCCLFAFVVGGISDTVIESINKIGSVFYGPVLAVFVLAYTTRFVSALPAIIGLIVGVALNIVLWLAVPSVSWLWWNVFGFVVAAVLAVLLSLLFPSKKPSPKLDEKSMKAQKTTKTDMIRYGILAGATLVILFVTWGLSALLS